MRQVIAHKAGGAHVISHEEVHVSAHRECVTRTCGAWGVPLDKYSLELFVLGKVRD